MYVMKLQKSGALSVLAIIAFMGCSGDENDESLGEPNSSVEVEALAAPTCTPTSPAGFKSRVIPQFYTADEPTCLYKYSIATPTGKRPACAVTSWNPSTHLCTIIGIKPGCACYEGQAHACDLGAAGSPASPCISGTNCGVVTCNLVNDSSSTWNGCTSLCSCE